MCVWADGEKRLCLCRSVVRVCVCVRVCYGSLSPCRISAVNADFLLWHPANTDVDHMRKYTERTICRVWRTHTHTEITSSNTSDRHDGDYKSTQQSTTFPCATQQDNCFPKQHLQISYMYVTVEISWMFAHFFVNSESKHDTRAQTA